jgi:cytochrome c5
VGLAIAILILAIIISKQESGSERSASYKEALIAPIGKVNTEPGKMVAGGTPEAAPGSAPAAQPAAQQARSGKEIVESVCSACHGTGVLNAPKIGDNAAWQPRIAQGVNVLLQHAIQGFKAMPAKGGVASLSEEDMKKAVSYMLERVGVAPAKAEAQAPAAQASTAQAPPAQAAATEAPAAQAPAAAPSAPAPQATSADKGKQAGVKAQ